MSILSYLEDRDSQVPALRLLQQMGYTYLPPEDVARQRGGSLSSVVLDEILTEQLRKLNHIEYKGQTYDFTPNNIERAVKEMRDVMDEGLVITNEKIYDLLTLGKSYEQIIQGDKKSHPLRYIDWEHPEQNVYHVTDELEVKGLGKPRYPDIVLFVNGIPFVVIECKRRDKKNALDDAISQQIRNQKKEFIPRLFHYTQLLIATSVNEFMFGTTDTSKPFWAVWREQTDIEDAVRELVVRPDENEQWNHRLKTHYRLSPRQESESREPTLQDRNLYSLCRPERLLDMTYNFTVFDNNVKKVARYQQYFGVKRTLERVRETRDDGTRKGGVIWHTQGSGKSITMVFMSKNLALAEDIPNHRIILVTDRTDLDDQLWRAFKSCGKEITRAKTGKHLGELVRDPGEENIATTIHKFDAALNQKTFHNESPNIFVLVDEGHRTQYGEMHAKMRKILPNACYIGFTGTPLMKDQKSTARKFGGIIDAYPMKKAVEDKAVVPLLYEGRAAKLDVWKEKLDREFEQDMEGMAEEQKVEYKSKYSSLDKLLTSKHIIKEIARDITEHYEKNLKGTSYKAQLAVPNKLTGLKYYRAFKELGRINAELVISPPDTREGHEDVYEDPKEEVQIFWNRMMEKHGSKENYESNIINLFKSDSDDVELLIVVNKLLTGFDAPRNTVMYLAKRMEEHNLLQAIARVNRRFEGKDYGHIIDYRGVLGNLTEALSTYDALANFDENDLKSAVLPIQDVIDKLPQLHSDLWDVFKECENKQDKETMEQFLRPDDRRDLFYERLSNFARTLQTAYSADDIYSLVPEEDLERYKRDLKFFESLRRSVRLRYAESIDHQEYEARVQKLIDSYVGSEGIEQVVEAVDIFSKDFSDEQLQQENPSPSSQADRIAHNTKKVINERMEEDPALYKRFSEMIVETIRKFLADRISDQEYLEKMQKIRRGVEEGTIEGQPSELHNKPEARAFYGIIKDEINQYLVDLKTQGDGQLNITPGELEKHFIRAGIELDNRLEEQTIVDWTSNPDVKNRMFNTIEDYMIELFRKLDLKRNFDVIERIAQTMIKSAERRYAK